MDSTVNFNKKEKFLNRKIFGGVTYFETILFSIASIVGISLFIWQIVLDEANTKNIISYTLTLIDIPLGIIAAIGLSRKWKYAPLLLAFDAILYGTSNFLSANYSLGVVNAIIIPVLWIVAFFYLWSSNLEENYVSTRKLNLKIGALLVLFIVLISSGFGFVGMQFEDNNQTFEVWFDSFAAVLMLFAVILSIFRFRETWFLFFIANTFKIILFSFTISQGNLEDIMLLVLATSYFINSIYGMIIWQKSKLFTLKSK